MLKYQLPMFQRLEPETPWQIGRVADTDNLTLDDAARFASKQSGTEILPADFLRAASRGEIPLNAIVHHGAKLKKHDGGIYCNQGTPAENTVPKGAIPPLPLSACQHLASTGQASWRTFDGFETIDGVLMRFTVAALEEGEPDFETLPADCRVTGWNARALADAFMDIPDSEAPIETLKNTALVKEFANIWPSIERDLRDKTRHANALLNEANIRHGYYDVEKALRWAKMEGKISKQSATSYTRTASNSVLSSLIGQIYNLN